MDNKKVEEKCELIIDVINKLIDDLNTNEMVIVIQLIIQELSNIIKVYDEIFK